MELIYAYSGRGIRNIQNHEFNFSNNFNVKFNEKDKKLFIKKIKNNKESFIYQLQNINENKKNKIENITLIVGKNGTGKSTILKLLGYSENQRDSEFGEWFVTTPLDNIVATRECIGFYFWFAIYHIKSNEFIIEGNALEIINNLDFLGKEEKGIPSLKCFRFSYDFSDNILFNVERLNESSDKVGYMFYSTNSGVEWLNEYISDNNVISTDVVSRKDCNKLNFNEVAKLVFSNGNSINDILPNVDGFNIQIKLNIPEIFRKKMFGKLSDKELPSVDIYSSKAIICHYDDDLDNDRRRQQHFVLLFLEILIWKQFKYLGLDRYNIPEDFVADKNFNDYDERKAYLIIILNSLYNVDASKIIKYDDKLPQDDFMQRYVKPIIKRIEEIECHPFSSDNVIQISREAYIKYNESKDDFFKPFEEVMLNNWLNKECITVSAAGMSTGEAHLYDIYASLYYEIKLKRLVEGGTYILLMDEPEARMHPEWSREFLSRLVDILSEDEFAKYHWQVIITTHSPFMLSDVPKNNIICLSKGKDCIRLDNADCGFMANIYDLLGKPFFMESPFGMLAKRIVDKNINKIRKNKNMVTDSEIKSICEIFQFIDDEIIRESLKRMV